MERKARELRRWLAGQHGYRATSTVRSAQYDAPWTIPFLERNEVHITVEPVS